MLFFIVFTPPLLSAKWGKKMAHVEICFYRKFSEELPHPVRAGAVALKSSHALGDG